MPRPIRGGWVWDEVRIQLLVEFLRKRLPASKIAQEYNQRYETRLSRGNVQSWFRNKTVPRLLQKVTEDADELLKSYKERAGKIGRPRIPDEERRTPAQIKRDWRARTQGRKPTPRKSAAKPSVRTFTCTWVDEGVACTYRGTVPCSVHARLVQAALAKKLLQKRSQT